MNNWDGWTCEGVQLNEEIVKVSCRIVDPNPMYMPIRSVGKKWNGRRWRRQQRRKRIERLYKGIGDVIAICFTIIGMGLIAAGMFGILAFDSGVEAMVSFGMIALGVGVAMFFGMRE